MTEKRVRQVNVELPVGLRERFEDFCKENAYLRGRVIAAALTMFMAMPPNIRPGTSMKDSLILS